MVFGSAASTHFVLASPQPGGVTLEPMVGNSMIIIVMGVAGSGKTTIGTALAAALGCNFVDGDSLHPKENIEKMSHGIPLTDADRAPWLATIRAHIQQAATGKQCLVVASSALKQRYRDFLSQGVPVTWIYLKGSPELIAERLQHRKNHYAKADLLPSQFATLEEPSEAIVVDISPPPETIVKQILAELQRRMKVYSGEQEGATERSE